MQRMQSLPPERYERQRMIGQGSYGKVYLVRQRDTGETLVMKVINLAGMSRPDRDQCLQEAETLQKLDHPNILRYVESFVSNRALHIVTEHCARGDLERLIEHRMGRRLPDEQIAQIFSQVCLAVQYLHERHILHRDLKCANVFLAADGTVRIGDFGLAKVMAHTMGCAKTACGTPYYMAPEICQERPYHNRSDGVDGGLWEHDAARPPPPRRPSKAAAEPATDAASRPDADQRSRLPPLAPPQQRRPSRLTCVWAAPLELLPLRGEQRGVPAVLG
eukprot:gene45886-22671_t